MRGEERSREVRGEERGGEGRRVDDRKGEVRTV